MFGVCPVLFPHPHFVLPHLKEYGHDVLGLRKFRTLMANGSAVLPQWPTGRVSNKAWVLPRDMVPAGKELGGQTP